MTEDRRKRCPFCEPDPAIADPVEGEYEPGVMGTIYRCQVCKTEWMPSECLGQLNERLVLKRNETIDALRLTLSYIANNAARETNGKTEYEGDTYGLILKLAKDALGAK